MTTPSINLPSAHAAVDRGHLLGKDLSLFLDYDGTLVPLVDDPSTARLDSQARSVVESLSRKYPVVIVSGRSAADVRALAGIDTLTYAGSHGHEIEYPDGTRYEHPGSVELAPTLKEAAGRLKKALTSSTGVFVEEKPFAIAVHTRLVPDELTRRHAYETVRQVQADLKGLIVTSGKDIRELRPDIEWNKGLAIAHLIDTLYPSTTALFIGDDLTDEDGFSVVGRRGGMSVIVGRDPDRATNAQYQLADPAGVLEFLNRLGTSRTTVS